MELLTYPALDSTQDTARQLAVAHHALPFAVIATTQAHGRGREGKNWHSPSGGLWLTLALAVPSPAIILQAAMVAAYSMAGILSAQFGLQPLVKWPNDLLLNRRKVCGILAETLVSAEQTLLLVGVGLNVNNTLSQEQLPRATSLSNELGHPADLDLLATVAASGIERDINILMQHGFQDFSGWISDHLALRGETIAVEFNQQRSIGRVMGLSKTGGLLLENSEGALEEVGAGSIYSW